MRFQLDIETTIFYCLLAVTLLLSGCAPRMTVIEPPIEGTHEFSFNGTAVMEDEWWREFNDKNLNMLIDSAMGSNFDLAATWQQFLAAKSIVSIQASNKWPQIDASAQSAINLPEPDFVGGENTQLGLAANYEIDFWGRIGAGVQAEKLRAEASLFNYRTAAISVSAEIASTWFQLLAAKKQLQITEDQIATNENIIKVIRSRFAAGQVRAVDILRQVQLLESTREQQIIFGTNIAVLENRLAVLVGRQPQQEWEFTAIELPQLPELPGTGLPLELIRRRPDLQQSHALLMAADRDMAVAVGNKYPRISIGARGQLRSNNFDNLFKNWAYSISGNILAPLFYGGMLNAEVNRTQAIKQQRLYEYGQTTLLAFEEVENGLVRENMQKMRLENIGRQLDLAEKSNRQLRTEFLNGFSPYLDVLLGLDQEQQLQRDLVEAQSQQIQIRISLYRALAGGFDTGRNLDN
ncbi:MAG: efflux transporter outer membrane subunit [Sediminicola sp.]